MTPEDTIRFMAQKIEQALGHSYGWMTVGDKAACRDCGAYSHDGHDPECMVRDMEDPLYQALEAADEALKNLCERKSA